MTRRALRKSTPLKSEEMFIHLLKSRKSHDHLATLHCSSVVPKIHAYWSVDLLCSKVILISLLLNPIVGIPKKERKLN